MFRCTYCLIYNNEEAEMPFAETPQWKCMYVCKYAQLVFCHFVQQNTIYLFKVLPIHLDINAASLELHVKSSRYWYQGQDFFPFVLRLITLVDNSISWTLRMKGMGIALICSLAAPPLPRPPDQFSVFFQWRELPITVAESEMSYKQKTGLSAAAN